MKTLYLIGLVVAVVLAVGFLSGGMATSQTLETSNGLNATKTMPSNGEVQATIKPNQVIPDDSIFSWPIIVSLGVAVIGIVAFRRNTYY